MTAASASAMAAAKRAAENWLRSGWTAVAAAARQRRMNMGAGASNGFRVCQDGAAALGAPASTSAAGSHLAAGAGVVAQGLARAVQAAAALWRRDGWLAHLSACEPMA